MSVAIVSLSEHSFFLCAMGAMAVFPIVQVYRVIISSVTQKRQDRAPEPSLSKGRDDLASQLPNAKVIGGRSFAKTTPAADARPTNNFDERPSCYLGKLVMCPCIFSHQRATRQAP